MGVVSETMSFYGLFLSLGCCVCAFFFWGGGVRVGFCVSFRISYDFLEFFDSSVFGNSITLIRHMSNEKRVPGCLGYIGDYAAQLCGDYNEPL